MDYTDARFYAIGALGYGKGNTAEEAKDNYVKTQLRNFRAADTVYGTRPRFKAALVSGPLEPDVWHAPEGTTGFVIDHGGLHWIDASDNYTDPTAEQQVIRAAWRDLD